MSGIASLYTHKMIQDTSLDKNGVVRYCGKPYPVMLTYQEKQDALDTYNALVQSRKGLYHGVPVKTTLRKGYGLKALRKAHAKLVAEGLVQSPLENLL
jgi:hypothetical protein